MSAEEELFTPVVLVEAKLLPGTALATATDSWLALLFFPLPRPF